MKTFVYARSAQRADRWARDQGMRPRDFYAFGEQSHTDGWLYQPGDRVVVLGTLSRVQQAVVDRTVVRSNANGAGIEVERYEVDTVQV